LLTTAAGLVLASGATASGPLIVGNNAAEGGGPIQTYDFSTGGAPVASFVPTGASDKNNGRGVVVVGSEVFYTELTNGVGPTPAIEVAPYNGGAGGADTRTFPNPRPTVGIQDLAFSGGSLYALTGYLLGPLQVFKLNPFSGAVLGAPINITGSFLGINPGSSDGFTILPNGNFLINNNDESCTYNQYNSTTGAEISGTTITVPGASRCTGVDTDGTSLFFQTGFAGFTQTDLSGNLKARVAVSGNTVEDISLVHSVAAPLSPGYWKNHITTGTPNTQSKLPVSVGPYVVDTTTKATAILEAMSCGKVSSENAIGCLAAQDLGAELNIKNGSDPCINAAVTKANAWLSGTTEDGVPGLTYTGPNTTYTLTYAQRTEALALTSPQGTFNAGGGC
jgi:hypothetical protein